VKVRGDSRRPVRGRELPTIGGADSCAARGTMSDHEKQGSAILEDEKRGKNLTLQLSEVLRLEGKGLTWKGGKPI